MVLRHHVCIVFMPNPPIRNLEFPYCSSGGWLTLLKRCYWLVWQEYNTHVTMKDPCFCINQNKYMDDLLISKSSLVDMLEAAISLDFVAKIFAG